jgi:hypothetical protein
MILALWQRRWRGKKERFLREGKGVYMDFGRGGVSHVFVLFVWEGSCLGGEGKGVSHGAVLLPSDDTSIPNSVPKSTLIKLELS